MRTTKPVPHPRASRAILVGVPMALCFVFLVYLLSQGWLVAIHSRIVSSLACVDTPAVLPERGSMIDDPSPWPSRILDPIDPLDRSSDLAEVLNRQSEGLPLPRATFATLGSSLQPRVTDGPTPARRTAAREVAAARAFDREMMAELLGMLARPGTTDEDEPRSAARRLAGKRSPVCCVFTPSQARPNREPIASQSHSPESRPTAGSPVPVKMMAEVVAGPTNLVGPGQHAADETTPSRNHRLRVSPNRPPFEPIDPEVAPHHSVADDLNRDSEGGYLAPPILLGRHSGPSKPTGKSSDPTIIPQERSRSMSSKPASEMAEAMRLTRDAMRAWTALLARPASVQVSSR